MMTSPGFWPLEILLETARHVVDRQLLHGHIRKWRPILFHLRQDLVNVLKELLKILPSIKVVLLVFIRS